MADTQKHIMVVDDQPANLLLILRTLESQYRVTCIESGKACLEAMDEDKPDLVVMDVRMPGMSGYECCEIIKDNFEFQDIPVIFLSAHTEMEDKLKGYEAGGADYLTKPCDIKEVIAKIEHNLSLLDEFKNKLESANAFANMAMTNSGELGGVLQFMENSFQCEDQNSLADLIVASLESYGLKSCVQLRGFESTLNQCSTGHCAPLEVSLMSEMIGGEKIMEFGKRCLCVSDNISFLVKNLPIDDELLCGRVKDHIVSILNGATARMNSLNIAHEKELIVINRIKMALEDIEKTLLQIEDLSEDKNKEISQIISNLNTNINESFASLALTEEQENHFMKLLDKSSNDLFKATATDGDLKSRFEKISIMLEDIIAVKI